MADLITSFLDQISSDHTRRAYETDLRHFFGSEAIRQSEVQVVTSETVQTLVRSMYRSGQARSTQRRRLAALRRFFDWLIERDVVSENPARSPQIETRPPETKSSHTSVLTRREAEQLVRAAGDPPNSGPRDQALVLTILYAALRRSEAAALEVDDVRPLGRHWIIDLDTAGSAKGGYVRIPEIVVESIEGMKQRYGITEGRLWRSLSNRNRGRPMSPDALYKVVRRTAKRADLDPVSIDTLRRTGLQLALKGGAELPKVQAHGRFSTARSAATLHEEGRSSSLSGNAVEHINLDVSDVLRHPE